MKIISVRTFYYVYRRAILLYGILYDLDIIRDFLLVVNYGFCAIRPAPFYYYSKEYLVVLAIRLYSFV